MLDGDLSVCFKRTIGQWKRWLITGVLTPTSLLSSVPVSYYILILTRLFKFWNLSTQKNDCFWAWHWWKMFLHMLVFCECNTVAFYNSKLIYISSVCPVYFVGRQMRSTRSWQTHGGTHLLSPTSYSSR